MECPETVLSLDIKNIKVDLLLREIVLDTQNDLWKLKL